MASDSGFTRLKETFRRRTILEYTLFRDHLLNFTEDEVLAARVALEVVGPAKSWMWEV